METKFKKTNQLVYIQYENPKQDGHIITVMDSYRNILGRIHETLDVKENKPEFTFIDYDGNQLFRAEKLDQLKEEISQNKKILFEKAHQRRLAKKQEKTVAINSPDVAQPAQDVAENVKELQNIRKQINQNREISR